MNLDIVVIPEGLDQCYEAGGLGTAKCRQLFDDRGPLEAGLGEGGTSTGQRKGHPRAHNKVGCLLWYSQNTNIMDVVMYRPNVTKWFQWCHFLQTLMLH